MARYLIYNGPMQTTAAPSKVTTGTAIKTMLQFKASATAPGRIVEWGVSFDGSAATTPGVVELVETDVAATVTAFVAADITKLDAAALAAGDPTTNLIQVGTAASGYTATAEGTTTSLRNLDGPKLIAPTNQYERSWVLGYEAVVQAGKLARIRMTFGAAINALCYMIIDI
jgi:hypothetical protein